MQTSTIQPCPPSLKHESEPTIFPPPIPRSNCTNWHNPALPTVTARTKATTITSLNLFSYRNSCPASKLRFFLFVDAAVVVFVKGLELWSLYDEPFSQTDGAILVGVESLE